MFLYEIRQERFSIFDTLKTKDRKIRGNCNLLIKVKFHKLDRSSFLSSNISTSVTLTYHFIYLLFRLFQC